MATRAVRILTDVAALDRPFDYAVTEATERVAVGDRVRVDLNNRSVRGWVVGEVAPERDLKPLTKWLGYGPPEGLLELLTWASARWCSPLSRFLVSSSPRRLVMALPNLPERRPLGANLTRSAEAHAPGVVQLAPSTDPITLVLVAYQACSQREGSFLVLVPNEAWARRLRGRLEQRGCSVASGEDEWDRMRAGWPVIVGSRGAALAPAPRLSGAVILDADDESYHSSAAPTWNAVTLLRERCSRDRAPLWCTSMMPSPILVGEGTYQRESNASSGWPSVLLVDRRGADPRDGALARDTLEAAYVALASEEPVAVAVVLQRLGTGRLFACSQCGELARCAQCSQGEEEVDGQLACRDRHDRRAMFCTSCGSIRLQRVRLGVTTLARDVGAQLSQRVSEVTATSDAAAPLERVVVGTEAIWQRVRRSKLVIFADFDQYLLAPRDSSRREAVYAVGKAGRLVGGRQEGRGSVLLQTRRGEDPVVGALIRGNVDQLVTEDVQTARLLALPPFGALAHVSGDAAEAFVTSLDRGRVSVHRAPDGFTVRATDPMELSSTLRAAVRPSGKLRIAVQ